MNSLLKKVKTFNLEILKKTFPSSPVAISNKDVIESRYNHILEEIDEFREAKCLEDQADAMIDTIYLALGTLLEMGIAPGPWFKEVHSRNMQKLKGLNISRPDNKCEDAVKPEGWNEPNFDHLLDLELDLLTGPLKEAQIIRRAKSKDYQNTVSTKEYFPYGDKSYYHMLNLKLLRIKSTMGSPTCNESTRDSLLDLINYASMMIEAIDREDF